MKGKITYMICINEFINRYSELNNITKKQAREEIERFILSHKILTYENGGVNLRGYMNTKVVNIPAKMAKNPRTGESISIPAKKIVKIKISSKFKNMTEENI